MINPWPDEHEHLAYHSPEEIAQVGGKLTRELTKEAKEKGYFNTPKGLFPVVCVRCSFQEKGKFQHRRDEWHTDRAEWSWLWVDGPGPTELRSGPVPRRQFIEYSGQEHRCPPQEEPGWRYFYRILWVRRKLRSRKVK